MYYAAVLKPWCILITPREAWAQLRKHPSWLYAVSAQWIIASPAMLISSREVGQITRVAGFGLSTQSSTWISLAGYLLSTAVVILVMNLLAALACWLVAAIVGISCNFWQALTWLAHSALPYVLGVALSWLLLTIAPLSPESPAHALSLLLRPSSLGPAPYLQQAIPPLSLIWFLTSYIDVFGLWSLAVLTQGARFFLGASVRQTTWIAGLLVLLFLAVLTSVWQASQWLLVRLAAQ